jgi:hypothetical protein
MKWMLCALLLLTVGWTPALAEGAVAVGLSSNVAKNGVAVGLSADFSTSSAAQRDALNRCKSGAAATKTRAVCKVVQTFSNKCAAISTDPKPGTPGFGWAVAVTGKSAASIARSNCNATAGARRGACGVAAVTCDGRAR